MLLLFRYMRKSPLSVVYLLLIISWLSLVILTPWMDLPANIIHLDKILQPPSLENHWSGIMGYDDLGRSILARLVDGAQISFAVAFGVASICLLIGTTIGVCSAYVGGVLDHLLLRVIDVFLAFPGILLAIALAGLMGPGIDNVIIALSVVGWVGYARLARAQVLSVKQREHIAAAIVLGLPHRNIILRHILPLIVSPLLIEFTFAIAGLVIAEAGLSFLGLGIQAPHSSWGNMIKDGSQYLLIAPHLVLFPGLALMLVVLSINQLGDSLRDYLDPQQRKGVKA